LELCRAQELFLERWIFNENIEWFSLKKSVKKRKKHRNFSLIVGMNDIVFKKE
jgi:hypothetical protein